MCFGFETDNEMASLTASWNPVKNVIQVKNGGMYLYAKYSVFMTVKFIWKHYKYYKPAM